MSPDRNVTTVPADQEYGGPEVRNHRDKEENTTVAAQRLLCCFALQGHRTKEGFKKNHPEPQTHRM